ncbi:MAG: hypothetical protein AB1813_05955 [Verrucomicrobiota bacterium]|jgi:hypothetical protein
MNPRLIELAEKRTLLVARAELERQTVAFQCAQWARPVRWAEQALGAARTLREAPWIFSLISAFLVASSWRKLARFPRWLWIGWKLLRIWRSWKM